MKWEVFYNCGDLRTTENESTELKTNLNSILENFCVVAVYESWFVSC